MIECIKCGILKEDDCFSFDSKKLNKRSRRCKDCDRLHRKSKNFKPDLTKLTKICSKCGIEHDISKFNLKRTSSDGYDSHCCFCKAEYVKARTFEPDPTVLSKICNSCGEEKLISMFHKHQKHADGYRGICIECNLEKTSKLNYDVDHSITVKTCSVCKIEKDVSEFTRNRFHKTGLKSSCKQCEYDRDIVYRSTDEGKKTLKLAEKNRLENNPLFALRKRYMRRLNESFKGKPFGKKSSSNTILGCSYEYFRQYIDSFIVAGESFKNLHLDHIIPASLAKTEADVLSLNHYTNLRPLSAKDNLAKSDKILHDVIESHFKNYPDSPAYRFYLDHIV